MLKKAGSKWVLYSKDGSKKLGTFDTEKEAKERERQIIAAQAAKESDSMDIDKILSEIAQLAEVAGSLRDTANRIEEAFHAAYSPDDIWEGPYRVRDVFADNALLGNSVVVLDKQAGTFQAVAYTETDDGIEFAPRAEWQTVELVYQLVGTTSEAETLRGGTNEGELSENADFDAEGIAVEVARDATEADLSEAGIQAAIESGRRAPVVVDFRILNPGPGNKRDNRYYPANVVKRDIHVFEGADVFATDHKDKERSERTKVGKVLQCPARFMENGAPVAPVLIYDPYQAEKARNRNDAGALNTLECSIFGRGRAKDGKVDGQKYKVVEAITEGIFIELVSKGGAGGQAESLSESSNGGSEMEKDQEQKEAESVQAEEVDISEDAGNETETVTMLEGATVESALAETNLPSTFKSALALAKYASDDELGDAIAQAVKEVKAITGSGQPFAQGESSSVDNAPLSEAEIEEQSKANFNRVMAEIGLKEVA
jgi:hypothetical protein